MELARHHTHPKPASFGWQRFSLDGLAQKLASKRLLESKLSLASPLAVEAVWARVVHLLAQSQALGRFSSVKNRPGFPRALARTVSEIRLEAIPLLVLDPDLARAAEQFERLLADSKLVDRAELLHIAASAISTSPLVLLDVSIHSRREAEFVSALLKNSRHAIATVPHGDDRTLQFLSAALGHSPEALESTDSPTLQRLQNHLFSSKPGPSGNADPDVTVLSAPGEARECVELARMIHEAARAGTPFDRIAVLLRAPAAYRSRISEALRRAEIPAYFAEGTQRVDASGRAFLALLACANERLSASRFAEYLSFGEVPKETHQDTWAPPDMETDSQDADLDTADETPAELAEADVDAPIVAGTLRAPRYWERLLNDAAVIGGKDRWVRRLEALENALIAEKNAPDVEERKVLQIDRNLSALNGLRAFALPILDQLENFPSQALWSEWLERLSTLAGAALQFPHRVASVLTELQVMGEVGPVSLLEVQAVLSERLLGMTRPPNHRRFGQVFVGPIESARGMSFDVVFVPGLAERIFPQKVREDPIALDSERQRIAGLGHHLQTHADRRTSERLLLRLAVGAAKQRVILSYPRLDAYEGRPRVPSFYVLDALKACEGKLPTYEELSQRAENRVHARMGWPAPNEANSAIDDAERDLSVLGALFHDRSGEPKTGRARYLLRTNSCLSRTLRMRWARWNKKWTEWDGLVAPSAEAQVALERHQLSERAFSATALQHFSACPYRFYLSTIVRLSAREEAASIEELDPLQKGSMVHDVQFDVMSALRDRWPAALSDAFATIDAALEKVATERRELFHPVIARVWDDDVEAIRADIRAWMRLTLLAEWTPWKFELSFGLPNRDRADPDSRTEGVQIAGGLRLRGSIDLVERHASRVLAATDYKTGRQRANSTTRIGGGKSLQPVLYALALEQLFPDHSVAGGTLWYCTQAGNFEKFTIPLDDESRSAAAAAVGIVGKALQKGFFPAAPAENECTYCEYLPVCGTQEERRVKRKSTAELASLKELRKIE